MTNAEAAYILSNLAWLGTRDEQDKVEAAIRIAVEELRSGGEKGMSDLIRRQAVLDLIAGWTYDLCYKEDEWRAEEEIENLPSAQPDIIRCRNCKFASGDSRICMQFGHSPIGELDFCAWAERRTDEE